MRRCLFLLSALLFFCSMSGCQRKASIEELRTVYPFCDQGPDDICWRSLSFQECIDSSPCYAAVSVISVNEAYYAASTVFYPVTLSVDQVVYQPDGDPLMEVQDTIRLTLREDELETMPSLNKGMRYILGLAPAPSGPHAGYYITSKYTMFYITSDDRVLSVTSEETSDQYSGLTAADLCVLIKETKLN